MTKSTKTTSSQDLTSHVVLRTYVPIPFESRRILASDKDRYGLPYTYCGCPLTGETLGQQLRHALSLYRHRIAMDERPILIPLTDERAVRTPATTTPCIRCTTAKHPNARARARDEKRRSADGAGRHATPRATTRRRACQTTSTRLGRTRSHFFTLSRYGSEVRASMCQLS